MGGAGHEQRLQARLPFLGAGDKALLAHLRQDEAPAGEGFVRVAERVELMGRGEERDEQGGFAQAEPLRGFVEEEARGGLDAGDADGAVLPEIHLVEVKVEDVDLAGAELQPQGEGHLADLPPERPARRQVQVAGELLGDGAAALDQLERPQVPPGRPRQPAQVHAPMAVDAAVLDRDDGVEQVAGEPLEAARLAADALGAGELVDELGLEPSVRRLRAVRVFEREQEPASESGLQAGGPGAVERVGEAAQVHLDSVIVQAVGARRRRRRGPQVPQALQPLHEPRRLQAPPRLKEEGSAEQLGRVAGGRRLQARQPAGLYRQAGGQEWEEGSRGQGVNFQTVVVPEAFTTAA